MYTTLRSVGFLDVLSNTPAESSLRAPCIHARLRRLAAKLCEKSGLATKHTKGILCVLCVSRLHFWLKENKFPDAFGKICRYGDYRDEDMDYYVSLNGLFSAYRNLEQAARRISTPDPTTDYAAELIAADQARTAGEANLRVISVERELEGAILDIFA